MEAGLSVKFEPFYEPMKNGFPNLKGHPPITRRSKNGHHQNLQNHVLRVLRVRLLLNLQISSQSAAGRTLCQG